MQHLPAGIFEPAVIAIGSLGRFYAGLGDGLEVRGAGEACNVLDRFEDLRELLETFLGTAGAIDTVAQGVIERRDLVSHGAPPHEQGHHAGEGVAAGVERSIDGRRERGGAQSCRHDLEDSSAIRVWERYVMPGAWAC
ncbi:hypothetical protein [Burkholderia cenocepacia]|uniref:hypothetical protein n=1 Tax=Burkholderia cenocepacia TaxID=95486 RepID=UPI00187D136F|nr:hypothetical protein [Burkholderia cenocepacia]